MSISDTPGEQTGRPARHSPHTRDLEMKMIAYVLDGIGIAAIVLGIAGLILNRAAAHGWNPFK